MISGNRIRGGLLAALSALLVVFCCPYPSVAQTSQSDKTQELQDKLRTLQQQMDQLNQELKALQQQQQQQNQDLQKATVAANKAQETVTRQQSLWDTFMKGF